MTFEEKQDYEILKVFMELKSPITGSSAELDKRLGHICGDASYQIVMTMVSKGWIKNFYVDNLDAIGKGFRIDKSGINKYHSLRRLKQWEPFKGAAFWITFVAAIVSAIYAVLQFHFSDSINSEKSLRTKIPQEQTSKHPLQPKR